YAESVNGPNFCGSWLASDGGVSGGIDAEGAGPFAGKPAPVRVDFPGAKTRRN
ncbi:hypothetical protein ACVWYU_002292, partial [Pseudomonas sp. TE12234]